MKTKGIQSPEGSTPPQTPPPPPPPDDPEQVRAETQTVEAGLVEAFNTSLHLEGQSSACLDDVGQSSADMGDAEGRLGHSGEGSTSAQSSTNQPSDRKIQRQRVYSKMLCHLHQKQASRRNTTTVACQTDETHEFGPLMLDPSLVDDPSCSEGTLRLMIQNFRNMGDTVRGPTKRIQNVSWRIMVMPRQHVVQKKGTQKCLGFFLQCCPEAFSDSWSCQAGAELRLISQRPGIPHFTRKTTHIYTAKENDWGYSCFMTWADILDEGQGYIKDDRVVLEVTVKADPPRNIVGIEEFRKGVQNWIELADLQFSRGKIDLAIEANSQGLKLCKDKDAEYRKKLEDQKRTFIERKLTESIQRIETASAQKKETTDEGDSVSNQTALRMALTANNHGKNKNNKNKKFQKNTKPRAPTPNNQPKVTTKEAVKTENAKTVQQNETPKEEEKEDDMAMKKKETKQRSVKNLPARPIATEAPPSSEDTHESLISGRFNKKIYNRLPSSWARRNKVEEEEVSHIGALFNVDGELAAAERDSFVMNFCRYMTDQMRAIIYPQGVDGKKKMLYNMQQLRTFAESAFEVEMQRQTIIRKASSDAVEYSTKAANAQTTDLVETEEFDIDLKVLWENDKKELRALTIDREAAALDAKIRLFWDALGGMEKFFECDASDRDSIASSDSADRQIDGCLKPKRTRLELVCESCIKEKMNYPMTMDSEVQTDEVTKNSPILKDSKKLQKVISKTSSKVECNKQSEKSLVEFPDAPLSPDDMPLFPPGMFPAPLSNYKMGDFGPHSSEVVHALSTVAMNCINSRRIHRISEEFLYTIHKKQVDEGLKIALRDISKIAGIAYIENEVIRRIEMPCYEDEMGDNDFASIFHKLLKEENKDRFILGKLVERFEAFKDRIDDLLIIDNDDVDRLIKGANAINLKVADFEKKMREFQKMNEDLELRHKKNEKQLKDELKQAKHNTNQEKDKNNQLNRDLKEKTKLIKQLETKVTTLQSEKDDVVEKQKQLQKELQGVQKRAADDAQKAKRDIQHAHEAKRHLQNDLNSRDHDLKAQSAQLEERNKEIKKLKEELSAEKNKLQQMQQTYSGHVHRAEQSEIALLQYQLEAGLSLLDRAMVDAKKKMKEMEDAASNRARSANEVTLCIQSRDEWSKIIDEIKKSIEATKAEHEEQIEAIKHGKALASLPKIAVPKPPPAPQIVKVAPIAPVEPTKPTPGVIGSRPTQSASSNAPTTVPATSVSSAGGTSNIVSRALSPNSRAPGSPVNKPSSSAVGNSPARHAPIGTRPNGTVVNGCSAETSSSSTTNNNNMPWSSWSDSFASITESFHPTKRFGSEDRDNLFSNDLLSSLTSSIGQSTWLADDHWSNAVNNLANNVASSTPSFLGPLNMHGSQISQQASSSLGSQHHPSAVQQSSLQHAQQQVQQSSQQAQQIQQQQQQPFSSGWNNYPEMHRQYMYRQQQQYQAHLAIISKKIGMDLEKTNDLVTDFCREHKVHYQNITGDDSVVEKIREFYNKRIHAMRMSAPPGAAPGYLTNPLVSVLERPNYGLMGDHSLNDRSNGLPGMEKW